MNLLNCDSCGAVIREGNRDLKPRYRALLLEPGRDIFTLSEGWDFCSLGCLATWATHQEIQQAAPSPNTETGP